MTLQVLYRFQQNVATLLVTNISVPVRTFLLRRRSRMRMAARGRVRQPRLLLLARNPHGDAPRFCAQDGGKGALDGCRLWIHLADHASLRHHVFHRLAEDGLLV